MHSRHNFSNGPISASSGKSQYQYNNANGNGRYIHPHGHPSTLKPLMSLNEQDDSKMMTTTQSSQHPQYQHRYQSSEENAVPHVVAGEGKSMIAIKCDESAANASDANDIDAAVTLKPKTAVCIINEMVRSSKVNISFHFSLGCSFAKLK